MFFYASKALFFPFVPSMAITLVACAGVLLALIPAVGVPTSFLVPTIALSLATRFVVAPRAISTGGGVSATLRSAAWLNLAACLLVLLATTRMTITLH